MGNSSCFLSGPGLSCAEKSIARCRYCRARDRGSSELSRDKFISLLCQGNSCLDRLFHIVDKDGNGTISFKEICEWIMANRTIISPETKLQVLFRFYDKDGDGKLSKFELSDAMILACTDELLPRPQVNQLVQTVFGVYDQDKDNHLNYAEFSNLMRAAGAVSW